MSESEAPVVLVDEDKRRTVHCSRGGTKTRRQPADEAGLSGPEVAGERQDFASSGKAACEDPQMLCLRGGICPEAPLRLARPPVPGTIELEVHRYRARSSNFTTPALRLGWFD